MLALVAAAAWPAPVEPGSSEQHAMQPHAAKLEPPLNDGRLRETLSVTLGFTPKRFLLVANNDKPSMEMLSCVEQWRMEPTDAVVRFNHMSHRHWFDFFAHLVVQANRKDTVRDELAASERLAPKAMHALYCPEGLEPEASQHLPDNVYYFTPYPEHFGKLAPELAGALPSSGFAMLHFLHEAFPEADIVTVGFDFHANDEAQTRTQDEQHAFGGERSAAARLGWLHNVCQALHHNKTQIARRRAVGTPYARRMYE